MPKTITLLSWNVNGLRGITKGNFLSWLDETRPDILGLQETKVSDPALLPDELREPPGYEACWRCGQRKGYSGVVLYTRIKPKNFITEFKQPLLNTEGRVVGADFGKFILFNVYFPNGKMGPDRLDYKMKFYDQFLQMVLELRKRKKSVIFCGDINTAHKEIDLARPKANERISGFLPMERAWIDKVVKNNFIDTFRLFHPGPGQYSWWDLKTGSRKRNVGWRIDYFFISKNLKPFLKDAFIMKDVMGSDHCPVGIVLAQDK